jgi:DNA modification methylase
MGSGSTGVAALNDGYTFVGIELDDDYYKIATERLKQNELQTL